jgi:hypothetical protein
MRQLLDDAIMIYRQEIDAFLTVVAPAAVLGPVLVIVAASGRIQGFVAMPLLLLILLATYAACVRAATLVLRNLSPDPATAWTEALQSMTVALRTMGVPALGIAVALGCGLSISHDGFPLIGFGVGVAGVAAFASWAVRHAYDQSLALGHDLPAHEAARVGGLISALEGHWTRSLLAALGAPLLLAFALSWLVADVLAAPVGAAILILAIALWLPLPSLALTIDCDRLLADATEPPRRATAPATR